MKKKYKPRGLYASQRMYAKLQAEFKMSRGEIRHYIKVLTGVFIKILAKDKILRIQNFGIFTVRKRKQHWTVHPVTKERIFTKKTQRIFFKPKSILHNMPSPKSNENK